MDYLKPRIAYLNKPGALVRDNGQRPMDGYSGFGPYTFGFRKERGCGCGCDRDDRKFGVRKSSREEVFRPRGSKCHYMVDSDPIKGTVKFCPTNAKLPSLYCKKHLNKLKKKSKRKFSAKKRRHHRVMTKSRSRSRKRRRSRTTKRRSKSLKRRRSRKTKRRKSNRRLRRSRTTKKSSKKSIPYRSI